MTFEEAYEALNQGGVDAVANEMKEWHPSILGMMLSAVDSARRQRYRSYHPDFDDVLKDIFIRSPKER